MRNSSLVFLALVLFAPSIVAQAEAPIAHDGHPGLGVERSSREYAELLRSPDDEEQMLEGIRGLEAELRELLVELEQELDEEDYFDLLEKDDARTLAGFRERFALLAADPLPVLIEGGERGEALARAWMDIGLRLRLEALDSFEEDARDVRVGLNLIQAMNDGFVDLRDAEAREAARRIDLGAALMRVLRLDLAALRPRADNAPGRPQPAWVVELIGIAKSKDSDQRRTDFDTIRRKLRAREDRMRQTLFSPRLRERLSLELGRRGALRDEAQRRLRSLLPLLPETEEGKNPPKMVEEMPKLHRYGMALRISVEGLSFDLFDEDLSYYAGISADFFRTRQESRAWFDRYLALRGIRSHDGKTYRKKVIGRELNEHEKYALSIVQQVGLLGR